MEKTTITKFYPYQKKSSSGLDDIKRLNKRGGLLKNAEIVQTSLEKNVDSTSPIARNTRSSTRAKSKPITRQSSKINDFFKSQTEYSDELNVTLSKPSNNEKDDIVAPTLEKSCDSSSKISDEPEILSPGFVTPTKSKLKFSSPQKRRYIETVSLSDSTKTDTPEPSTTKDEEKTTFTHKKNISSLHKSRSVRKKLSLGDDDELNDEIEPVDAIIKKKSIELKVTKATLSKCMKLEELQKHLLKMKELKEQHNQITKAAKSPVKSPRKVTQNEATNKTVPSPKKVPAYERFKHLILPSVPTLTLPSSYTVLEDFFKCTDTVVSMLFNRSEVCTLTKVKAAVQEMAKRNFEAKILGQIKTVYPGAYEFKQEKGLPKCGYKYQGYQLTLTPLFDAINSKDASDEKMKFTSSDILRRQKIFHSSLVNLVKKKHKIFLQNINVSIPDEKLTRWHPRFRLDEIPEIEPSALPEPPFVKVYQTAKDVLEDTKKRLHPKVKTALENVAAASAQQTTVITTTPASNSKKEDLKGIPQGLLERIRAKEAQRLEESITRSPKKDQKNKMLDRLPEISRILRTYFVTEKKPALLFDHLLEKISESYKSPISKADVENHLKLLLEVAPTWITVANTIKGKYIKIDKTIKLQNIHEKINQYRKSL